MSNLVRDTAGTHIHHAPLAGPSSGPFLPAEDTSVRRHSLEHPPELELDAPTTESTIRPGDVRSANLSSPTRSSHPRALSQLPPRPNTHSPRQPSPPERTRPSPNPSQDPSQLPSHTSILQSPSPSPEQPSRNLNVYYGSPESTPTSRFPLSTAGEYHGQIAVASASSSPPIRSSPPGRRRLSIAPAIPRSPSPPTGLHDNHAHIDHEHQGSHLHHHQRQDSALSYTALVRRATVGSDAYPQGYASPSMIQRDTAGISDQGGGGGGGGGVNELDTIHPQQPLPPLPVPATSRSSPPSGRVIRLDDKPFREKTVGERLDPTLELARAERDKYALKAKVTGYALNAAIGLQVVIGALTTGLSVVTEGRQTSIMTAILGRFHSALVPLPPLLISVFYFVWVNVGGFATIVASYLARARGSNEPELSITRVKDLEQFIRECETFKLDHGHLFASANPEHNEQLGQLRDLFEELLGNANGERRLAPPV